ncbi:putative membrane protein [Streptococcus rupicaprae]|uniref:Membrane protein n=1 Tax=Streptococcus rupicaprae TaxID=759619 RepID=A0ABV2FEY2_9STRE
MTGEIYLAQLHGYLKRLPKTDFDDCMAYFIELFDDAGPEGEEDLIASLGTPQEAAAEIMGDLLDKKIDTAKSPREKLGLVPFSFLVLLAAPLGFPLLLLIVLLVLTAILLMASLLSSLYAITIALLAISVAFLWESMAHFQTLGIFLLNLGGMLLSLGIGLFLWLETVKLSKLFGKSLVTFIQNLYRKVTKHG